MDTATATRVLTLEERIAEQRRILDARDGATRRYSWATGQIENVA